jgi:hypothetical protein
MLEEKLVALAKSRLVTDKFLASIIGPEFVVNGEWIIGGGNWP